MTPTDPGAARTPPGAALIIALGITQIVGWGSIYYGFGFLFQPIREDLGLDADVVAGAFSLALLCSGLAAPTVGALIDRHGGRRLMAAGSLAVAVLLALLSRAESAWSLYVTYAGLGVAMACTLYEPAFAVLTHAFRSNPRRAITLVTLFGGLAGTLFWPLTQALIAWLGWRDTLLALAAMNLFVCLPLHARVLPGGPAATGRGPALAAAPEPESSDFATVRADPMFRALRVVFVGHALLFSSVLVHLMSVLQHKGLSASDAALVGALIGPAQIVGRLLELTWGRRLPILRIGQVAICLLPAALLLLWAIPSGVPVWVVALFALPFGLGNGLLTIVRGSAVAELWGSRQYGRISGAIARPVLVANALGPLGAASLLKVSGDYDGVLLAMIAIGVTAAAVLIAAVRAHPGKVPRTAPQPLRKEP